MKTREEQRMMLAGMAMQGLLADSLTACNEIANETGRECCDVVAEAAVEQADALLAELDRAAPKPETPSPDADGWIEHRPGDPAPSYEGYIKVAFRCDDVDSGSVSDFDWSTHDSDSKNPDYAVVAWKPA